MSLVFSFDRKRPPTPADPGDATIMLRGDSKRTLLLVHGLTGTPNEMRHLAFYFHKRGYNVHCPVLANHGLPLDDLKRTTWEELYASLRSVFLAAVAEGDQVFVAGLSMSALLVLLLAEEFSTKVAGVVCLSPTLFFDGWNVPWYHRLLPLASHSPLKYYLYFRENPPYGIKNARIRAMVHRHFSAARLDDVGDTARYGYAFFPVSLFNQLERLARRVTPLLGRIHAPVLLIHPEEDDTASVKNSQWIFDRVASATKELVILHDSYHVITADQEREKVAATMFGFLGKL
ncbi:MAG: alpha/beta hydrolase [Opitutales bacterium]